MISMMRNKPQDCIELLGIDLLKQNPQIVREVDRMRIALGRGLGWHYVLDITWILKNLSQMGLTKGATILDAGAGMGLLQFILSERGYNVISVDFSNRKRPRALSLIYPVENMGGRRFNHPYIKHLENRQNTGSSFFGKVGAKLSRSPTFVFSLPLMWLGMVLGLRCPGLIKLYRADMRQMDFRENSVDVVVSVSAVEHMEKETVAQAVREFERVLKPGRAMICTTSAAKERDWFHQPSKGWCFSEDTLKSIFSLNNGCTTNWLLYSVIMEQIRQSIELQKRMSPNYRKSGDNGMPWGKWDPRYLPVGVIVTKKS